MKAEIQTAQDVWPMLTPVVFVPHAESEYQRLVAVLDDLIDVVGEDENHPLASLMEVIGVLIEKLRSLTPRLPLAASPVVIPAKAGIQRGGVVRRGLYAGLHRAFRRDIQPNARTPNRPFWMPACRAQA